MRRKRDAMSDVDADADADANANANVPGPRIDARRKMQ